MNLLSLLSEFNSIYPEKKFCSEKIKDVCFAWWVYPVQGRRRVVWDRQVQAIIANLLSDYEVVHLVSAIKKYGACTRTPQKYYYGMSTFTLEYFLTGQNGTHFKKFLETPLEEFIIKNAPASESHITYQ